MAQVWRLEFLQPDGRWTGPYCAEYLTDRAYKLRQRMCAEHRDNAARPWPCEQVFANNPGRHRYVCGSHSFLGLLEWFESYLALFFQEQGHVSYYDVPEAAVAERDSFQVVYQQRQAVLIHRFGKQTIDPATMTPRPGGTGGIG